MKPAAPTMGGMVRFSWLWIVVACAGMAFAQQDPSLDLKGSLVLLDTTPDTTPVAALSVAIYSPATFAMYRAQPDETGRFELRDVRPGHYRLEMGVPSRLVNFTVGGRDVSPAGFALNPDTSGPMRIVLSMKTGALTVNAEGAPSNAPLAAVLVPNDEFLTLHAQFSSPVTGAAGRFPFVPPGAYRVFVVDADLSGDLGARAELREALQEQATAVEVVAGQDTRVAARYIDRALVESRKRQLQPR